MEFVLEKAMIVTSNLSKSFTTKILVLSSRSERDINLSKPHPFSATLDHPSTIIKNKQQIKFVQIERKKLITRIIKTNMD